MRVSIITVCYNSAATIADTIYSIKNQNYNNIEHIIIDGKSTDNTIDIIEKSKFSGILISEKDNGIYDAMNKGIGMATGDIIGILNSDDFYPNSNILGEIVNSFSNSNAEAVYGDLHYLNEYNKVVRSWKSGDFHSKKFNYGWMPPHPTVFVKKEVYQNFGTFNTELRLSADYELMLRFMYINKIKTAYLPQVLVNMRTGGVSNSNLKNRLKAHKEDYKAWTYNGLVPKWYTIMMKPLRKVFQYNNFQAASASKRETKPVFSRGFAAS